MSMNDVNIRSACDALMRVREGIDNGEWPLPETMRESVVGDLEYRQGRLHGLLCLADLTQGSSNILAGIDPEHIGLEVEGALNAASAARGLSDAYANGQDWANSSAANWYMF